MILSEMRPDAIPEYSSDLGLRDIDHYDWAGDVRLHHPNLDLDATPNFIQQARESGHVNENATNCVVGCQTLNANQMRIFKQIESHYETLLTDPAHVEPLDLVVMGTAGTEKSFLINMIRDHLQEIARNHSITKSPILVLALTGVVTFNIRGKTIHSALSIQVSGKSFDLNGERLKNLQNRLKGVIYIIIDKKVWLVNVCSH